MGKYKLIAADLDGTILDDTYRIMPELLSLIDESRYRGVNLLVATGRVHPSAISFVQSLGVTLPVITSNGAVIKDPLTDELISHIPLERELAAEVLKLTGNGSVQRVVIIKDNFFTDAPEETTKEYSRALRVNFIRTDYLEDILTEDPTMIVVRGLVDEITGLTTMLRNHFGEKIYLANSKPFFIDINHPEVSKGVALLNVCKKIGINPRDVIAIGDGWNDREMFEVAGLGVAVANAPDQLKEMAGYVCEKASYKGVIEVIRKFIL